MRHALAYLFAPALAHRRALWWLNLTYFGTILVGMAYTLADPGAQPALVRFVDAGFSSGFLAPVVDAYGGAHLALAIVLTFVANLALGSGAALTLTSLVIPFGYLVGAISALMWDVMGSPSGGLHGPGSMDRALSPTRS